MTDRTILLTIKEVFAENIVSGRKRKEYRVGAPRISQPTRTIMYVPERRALIGEFTMERDSESRTSLGLPLSVHSPTRYVHAIQWQSVRGEIPGIGPPQQNFRYLDPANEADARLLDMIASFHQR